jgi:transcriptional regulator with XRE-family HTH domain
MSTFLRDQRLIRSLTPHDIAGQIGVHPTSVLRWERRERLPGPVHIQRLARTLGVDTAQVAAFFDAARASTKDETGLRGHGLRRLRAGSGLSASQVAGALGVPVATVYNWEAGRARLPRHHLSALADALHLDVEAVRGLLTRAPATRAEPPMSPLRRLRCRSGLAQAAVARQVGVSRQLVGRWERSEKPPPLFAVRRLALAYGVPVSVVARAAGVAPPTLLDPRRWCPGDLPAVLRLLREWSGLTQREVASGCRCSIDAARSWERGRAAPGPTLLRRLEDLYGLPPGSLVRALVAAG